jgi:hypothetical protein
LGPLVASGPFALVRNPLYLGNASLWIGFAFSANLPWLAPLFIALLGFEYHAIVRWEEGLLEKRLGDRYLAYADQVPRWFPKLAASTGSPRVGELFSWGDTFYSERGTLIAIGVGYLLLWLKARL